MAFVDKGSDKNWTYFIRLYHAILLSPLQWTQVHGYKYKADCLRPKG